MSKLHGLLKGHEALDVQAGLVIIDKIGISPERVEAITCAFRDEGMSDRLIWVSGPSLVPREGASAAIREALSALDEDSVTSCKVSATVSRLGVLLCLDKDLGIESLADSIAETLGSHKGRVIVYLQGKRPVVRELRGGPRVTVEVEDRSDRPTISKDDIQDLQILLHGKELDVNDFIKQLDRIGQG
jgi:hypothetical protein